MYQLWMHFAELFGLRFQFQLFSERTIRHDPVRPRRKRCINLLQMNVS